MNKLKEQKAITLIALVVTVIVLIILAGVSINLVLGDNGIITKAKEGKEDTIVGQEKEQVELAYISAAVKKLGDNVTSEELQEELNISVGDNKTEVTEKDDNILNVLFYDTTHNYNIDNGKVSQVELLELHISNYAELLDFANRVNNGELFEDYIVYLDNDIEIEDDDWIVIGTPGDRDNPGTHFSGTFEGNNHTINKLKLTTSKKYNGLFGVNDGRIQNLNVNGNLSGTLGIKIGLISGCNQGNINNCTASIECDISLSDSGNYSLKFGGITGFNSGTISNCTVTGEIITSGGSFSSTGGITGINAKEVANCKSFANINGGTENVGGITGSMENYSNSKIKQCENYGSVTANFNCFYNGGIIGHLTRNCSVEECTNKGDFTGDYYRSKTGGICGRMEDNSRIINCYVKATGYSNSSEVDGIVGQTSGDDILINNCYVCGVIPIDYITYAGREAAVDFITSCYYNKEISSTAYETHNATGLTTEEMKSTEFLTMLGDKFKADTNNINDGYPILSFE